jgi:putative endonuclease
MDNISIGKRGEELARKYFRKKGYTIVDCNFRSRHGEIDLVLRKNRAFRFVEVKFRSTTEFGLPQESVVKHKQQRIRNTTLLWLKRRRFSLDSEIHFDVLAISGEAGHLTYEYIEDAF